MFSFVQLYSYIHEIHSYSCGIGVIHTTGIGVIHTTGIGVANST